MAYTPYYSVGWQSGESGGTPITPAALNNMEQGIEDALPAANVYNGLDKTAAGFALDARQGEALNNKFGGITFNFVNLPANTQKTITVSNSARCILFFCSSYSSNCGVGALAHYGQGQSDGVSWFSQATGITINVSTNNSIKITATQAAVLGIMAITGTYTPQ